MPRSLKSEIRNPKFAILLAFLLFPASLALAADEAPRARAYFDFVHAAITQIQADLPAYSDSADAAAKLIANGKTLGVRGSGGLNGELGGRAGGFFFYNGGGGKEGDPILFFFGVLPKNKVDKTQLDAEIAQARKLKDAGSVVIGVASIAQLDALSLTDEARAACSFLLDNHAPAGDGLFHDANGRAVIPTFTVADATVAWTWSAELFAALTRLHKTPVMYKSFMVQGGRERAAQYKGKVFHDDIAVPPQPPGELGKAYLHELDNLLRDVGTASWPSLVSAIDAANDTLMDGGKVYVFAAGHYPPYHHGGQLSADPGIFTQLNSNKKFVATPGLADYIIVVGYSWPPGDKDWDDPQNLLRAAGRGVAWVLTGYDTKPADLKKNELLIDQQWPEGDALVKVPGYDIKLFPPSAVIAETIEFAIEAQVQFDLQEHLANIKHHTATAPATAPN